MRAHKRRSHGIENAGHTLLVGTQDTATGMAANKIAQAAEAPRTQRGINKWAPLTDEWSCILELRGEMVQLDVARHSASRAWGLQFS